MQVAETTKVRGPAGALRASGDPRDPRPIRVHALIDSLSCGGAEMMLAELARVAPGAGIDLTVGYLAETDGSPAARRLRLAGVEPQLVGVDSTLSRAALGSVVAHLQAAGPDVLHTHLPASDLLGGLAARRAGVPWVSTLHATVLPPRGRDRLRARLANAARRLSAARVVAVSSHARDAYLEASAIAQRRVVTIPNGVAHHPGSRSRGALRASLGIGRDEPLVLINAPLRREKGHALAFDSLKVATRKLPIKTLLIGSGADRREIEEAAATVPGLQVLGFRDDVADLLAAADVLLHTPTTDALPTNLIEAAAAGVPVVASATGGVPEIVRDGETGLLAPHGAGADRVADLLVHLLINPGLRARLGAAAKARHELEYDSVVWAERLRALYDSVSRRVP